MTKAKPAPAKHETPTRADLDRAFEALAALDILAVHNIAKTMSGGWKVANRKAEVRHAKKQPLAKGACFYHAQDLPMAEQGEGLELAFGAYNPKDKKWPFYRASKKGDLAKHEKATLALGAEILAVLQAHGLAATWSGSTSGRISTGKLTWTKK